VFGYFVDCKQKKDKVSKIEISIAIRLFKKKRFFHIIITYTCVGHRQDSRTGVGEFKVLIGKFSTVDGLSSGTIVVGEITTLAVK
jgi:hypothetical protein